MIAADPTVLAREAIAVDPRPCELCGLTIDRHEMIDDGDGPLFFCADISPDEMTVDELERRAELIRHEEVATILARLEAMDDPSRRLPPRSEPEPYRPAQSTTAAFRIVAAAGEVDRLKAWLLARPMDAPFLLALLESAASC